MNLYFNPATAEFKLGKNCYVTKEAAKEAIQQPLGFFWFNVVRKSIEE